MGNRFCFHIAFTLVGPIIAIFPSRNCFHLSQPILNVNSVYRYIHFFIIRSFFFLFGSNLIKCIYYNGFHNIPHCIFSALDLLIKLKLPRPTTCLGISYFICHYEVLLGHL